jgi:predicted ATPase/DNA-binding SARP family transcriptional activator
VPRGGTDGVDVRVEVLGPLRLLVGGEPVDVPGPKRRAVLALLARAEGRAVATDALLETVWPDTDADTARSFLYSQISRLRGHLGPAGHRLEAAPGGYRLTLRLEDLDVAQARGWLDDSRDLRPTDPAAARELLRRARELWRGAVLADLVGSVPALAAWTVTLDELRRQLTDEYLASSLDAGEHGDAVTVAREAHAADPLRETTVLLLMRALAATGREAEALQVGYGYRRRLADETGLDPTSALAELERIIAGGTSRALHPVTGGPSRLIGRDGELAALRRLLAAGQVVTVVGPGGVGKTALAVDLARQLDETTVLLLAPVSDPSSVPYALAAALGLGAVQADVLAACAAMLGAGERTLVVDNCEHLLAATAELLATLVASCPRLTVLATSREPLHLAVERQFRLAPLPLPASVEREDIERVPSVAVFLERARRVRPDLAVGPAELRLIAEIVRRLDGVPVAIELAASRLSSLSLADLHGRLDQALDLLGTGGRAADGRHRTLRATIEWSYRLHTEDEQRLFRHLAVFADGVDLPTAEQVAAELGSVAAAGTLARLVDASMIGAELGDRTRYRMLETLRTFGLDRLAAAGEAAQAEERLLAWAIAQARWIARTEATDREAEADAALRRERANLRAAWVVARRRRRSDEAIALVEALLNAAFSRDLTEIWQWARELADDPAIAEHPDRGVVFGMAAGALWLWGELDEAEELARRGLDVATSDRARWWCRSALANAALSRAATDDAIGHAVEAAQLATRATESYAIAALAATYAGDLQRARELRDRFAEVAASVSLQALHAYVAAEIENAAADYASAEVHYVRAMELAATSGATFYTGIAKVGLVTVRAAAGQAALALRGYRELIDYWERTGSWLQQWTTLRNLARLLDDLGDHGPARLLVTAADRAPDAPAVDERARRTDRSDAVGEDVPGDPAAVTRQQALYVARSAIDAQLLRATRVADGTIVGRPGR